MTTTYHSHRLNTRSSFAAQSRLEEYQDAIYGRRYACIQISGMVTNSPCVLSYSSKNPKRPRNLDFYLSTILIVFTYSLVFIFSNFAFEQTDFK